MSRVLRRYQAKKAVSTSDSAATADSAPNSTYSEEEQDVLDENLSIDAEGNIVDGSGKQLKVDDDGKVEVKKSDGTVIKVDADTVRKTIEKAENRRQRQLCCSDAVAAIRFISTADGDRTKDKSCGSSDKSETNYA